MSSQIISMLENEFPQAYWRRGLQYFETGRVTALDITSDDEDKACFHARIRGTHIYTTDVELWWRRDGSIDVNANCSCPIGFNCKHSVAGILKYLEYVKQNSTEGGVKVDEAFQVVNDWINKVGSAIKPVELPPENVSGQAVMYIVDQSRDNDMVWFVRVLTGRKLKSGGYGKLMEFKIQRIFELNIPSYVTELDIEIISMLCTEQAHQIKLGMAPSSEVVFSSHSSGDLFKKIIHSGRAFFRDQFEEPLSYAEPIPATLGWRLNTDGSQRLRFHSDIEFDDLIAVCPPHYLHRSSLTVGELQTKYDAVLAQSLALAPDIPPEFTEKARDALDAKIDDYPVPVPLPKTVQLEEVEAPTCRAEIYLDLAYIVLPHAWTRDAMGIPVARVNFKYGEAEVAYGATNERMTEWTKSGGVYFERSQLAEREWVTQLEHHGLRSLTEALPTRVPDQEKNAFVSSPLGANPSYWAEFMERIVPALKQNGWRISMSDTFPYNIVEWDDWYMDVDTSGVNWFGAELGIVVEGEKVNLLPILADLIKRGQLDLSQQDDEVNSADIFVPIDHKRRVRLPGERIRNIMTTLFELYEPKALEADGSMVLSRSQAFRLATLEQQWQGDNLVWSGAEHVRDLGRQLANVKLLEPKEAPPNVNVTLRDYQKYGIAWLQFLRQFDLGGILADDMGLGKTVQTIVHLAYEHQAGRTERPSLIVMPTSLISNWQREFKRFYPDMKVGTVHGPERKSMFAEINDYDVILTTYPLITRDAENWIGFDFHYIILDEAQYIKNPRAQVTQIIRKLTSHYRLCLSGTPIENHLGELWSQFEFLMPGYLSKYPRFKKLFQTPIEKYGNRERKDMLQKRVKPFVLRRTKDQVVTELPPKTDIIRAVKMDSGQRDLYEAVRLAMHQKVQEAVNQKGFSQSKLVILDALLKLRQVCCDPRLVKFSSVKTVKQSAKLNYLLDLVPSLVEEGRSMLIFSQFTSMLALIEQELKRLKLPFVKLTGQTKDRDTPVQQFQDGEVQIFLISLKAGGTGLNLTRADTVIHYDPWWNPAVEAQATDRAHRIGQTKAVFNYKFICEGSVEEKILELQEKKRKLVEGMYNQSMGDEPQFSEDDFVDLFSPLG